MPQSTLTFITESLPGFHVGVPANFQIEVSGGTPPYSFEITQGTLPESLSLNKEGEISGVPSRVADTTVFVKVKDEAGSSEAGSSLTQAFVVSVETPLAGQVTVGLSVGDKGLRVENLQIFLRRFGYLNPPPTGDPFAAIRSHAPSATPGIFDEATSIALSNFQLFHRLPVTGKLDEATLVQMSKPRCGVPDSFRGRGFTLSGFTFRRLPGFNASFVTSGYRWTKTNLTYRFANFTPDLTPQQIRDAISTAFSLWSQVTPFTFTEVLTATPDIEILFAAGDHGDGYHFDGPGNELGNTLAHAFYPNSSPNAPPIVGDAHFDEYETWSVDLPASGIDLVTLAAHEFGHSLGLDHSDVQEALMWPWYGGVHRFLATDDIAGIQAIYSPRPERGSLLHLAGVTSDGHLWHTIRFPTSWTPLGDVESQTGDRGVIVDVDLQSIGNEVHLCAVNSSGGLWHTIRRADGTWFPFGDVEGQTGDRGSFIRVGIAEAGGNLHVCGVTSDGHLWHTIRFPTSWTPFGDIEGQTGDRGFFIDVDCVGVNGELHVCGVTADGRLWHSIRRADGTWFPFGDVTGQTGDRGTIVDVACAGVSGELHVCAISKDGHLWHSIRRANGTWFPFGDVEGQAGDRGTFLRVSIAEAAGELHVSGVTADGRLWHTIRRADGTWFSFGDVKGQAGDPGNFSTVSVDGLFIP